MRRIQGFIAICVGALLVGCAKQGDEAPAQTAASEAAAPGAAPAEAPATPAPPPAAAPEPAATAPSTLQGQDQPGASGGLSQPEQPIATLPEAEKTFELSTKELEQLIGPLKADRASGGQAPAPLATGDARCPRACKAFDSLKRAGDAICRLAGPTDARCTKAKDVVKQNSTRVAPCGCKPESG